MPTVRGEKQELDLENYTRRRLQNPPYCNIQTLNCSAFTQFFQAEDYLLRLDPSLRGLLDAFQGIALDQKALFKWIKKLHEQTRKILFEKNKRLQITFEEQWEELQKTLAINQEIRQQRLRKQDIENALIQSYIAVISEELRQQILTQLQSLDKLYKKTQSIIAAEACQNFIAQLKNILQVTHNINDLAEKIKSPWDKVIDTFIIFSEVANIGIVFSIISKWWPLFKEAASVVGFYTDPVIYAFKSLIRITRMVGRIFFNVTFEDERYGTHQWQTAADMASLSFFGTAILMFAGAIIAGPLSITVAWVLALCGLAIVGNFDYAYPAQLAKERYTEKNDAFLNAFLEYHDAKPLEKEKARQKLILCKKEKDEAYDDYKTKKNAKLLYIAMFVGLALLLICGSIAAPGVATASVAFGMFVLSKIGSACLVAIALGRFTNFAHSIEWPRLQKLMNWLRPKRQNQTKFKLAATSTTTPLPKSPLSTTTISQTFGKNPPVNGKDRNPEGITSEEVDKIQQKYKAYKDAKFFSPLCKRFFTSQESKKLLTALSSSDISLTETERLDTVSFYLSTKKNQNKALYHIISEELNQRILKR